MRTRRIPKKEISQLSTARRRERVTKLRRERR